MTANVVGTNGIITVLIALLALALITGVPALVLFVAIRAILRRHKTWQEVKDQE